MKLSAKSAVIGLLGIAVGVVGLRLLQVSKLPIRSPLFGLGGRPGGDLAQIHQSL